MRIRKTNFGVKKRASRAAENGMKQQKREENLQNLPTELLLKILGHLTQQDLCRVSQVNRRFRNISFDPSLWKHLFIPHSVTKKKAEELIKRSSQQLKSLHVEKRGDANALGELALKICPKLGVLEMVDCKNKVTKSFMLTIRKHGNSLRQLNLAETGIKAGMLMEMGHERLSKLSSIRMQRRLDSDMSDVDSILRHCKALETVCLHQMFIYRNDDLVGHFLERNSATLKQFYFGGYVLNDSTTCIKLSQCSVLEHLMITVESNVSVTALRTLLQMSQRLKSLDLYLSMDFGTGKIVEIFGNGLRMTESLTKLNLMFGNSLNNAAIAAISSSCSSSSTEIRISCTSSRVSDIGCRSILRDCRALKHLNLEIYGSFRPEELFHSEGSGENLTCLELSGVSIEDAFLVDVLAKKCPKLQVLKLSCLHEITEEGVRGLLAGCPQLRILEVKGDGRVRKLQREIILKIVEGVVTADLSNNLPRKERNPALFCEHETTAICFCFRKRRQ